MKNIQFIIILAFLVVILAVNVIPYDSDRISQIESKIEKLDSAKKDSIRTVIDSTHVKIITNEKYYRERINTIINQSSSADSGFITDYIRLYSNKNPLSNIE